MKRWIPILLFLFAARVHAQGSFPGVPVYSIVNQACSSTETYTLAGNPGQTSNTAFVLNLNCNVTSSSVGGFPQPGNVIEFQISNLGGFTHAWPSNFINVPPLPYVGELDVGFWYDGTFWHAMSAASGCDLSSLANSAWNITCFGAVAVNTNAAPFLPGVTATINSGFPTATISNASTFVNGQGIAIPGAGPANSLSTPSAPTVTSAAPAGPWGSGYFVTGAAGGSETTCYRIVAMSKGGGLSAASPEQCVTGQTRGSQTTSLTSCVRSAGTLVTCTTSSAHLIAVGEWVFVHQTSNDPEYAGYHVVTTVPDNTHFTYQWSRSSLAGASTVAATGGIVQYGQANEVVIAGQAPPSNVWQYGIYRGASNAETFADVSMVVTPGVSLDASYMVWGDFGTSYTTVPTVSTAIWPTAYPTSATSDMLVTTICSGAGTTTLTLCGNAGTSVSGAAIVTDNTPNYIAAFTAASASHATVVVPPVASGLFGTNSILDISSFNSTPLLLSDAAFFGGTLVTNGNVIIANTKPNFVTSTQFALEALTNVGFAAKPGIYTKGGVFRGMAFNPLGTNTQGVFQAPGPVPTGIYEDIAFLGASGSNDFASVPLMLFAQGQAGAAAAGIIFRNIFTKGTAQGLTPNIISKNYSELSFDGVMQAGRGVMFSNCPTCTIISINWLQRLENQGPIMPLFVTRGNVGLSVAGSIEDTGSQPVVSHLGPGPLIVSGVGSAPSGGIPAITGSNIQLVGGGGLTDLQQGVNINYSTDLTGLLYDGIYNTQQALLQQNTHFALGPNYSLFTNGGSYAAPVCNVATAGPPFSFSAFGAGTYTLAYTPVYANGGQGLTSGFVNCTVDGATQQATIVISPAIAGAIGYRLLWGTNGGLGNYFLPTFTTTSILVPNGVGNTQGQSQPNLPGGGPAGIQNALVWGNAIEAVPATAAPSATLGTQFFDLITDNWPAFNVNLSANKYFLASWLSTSSIVNGDCVDWVRVGGIISLGDAGAACGSGGGGPAAPSLSVQSNCSGIFCGSAVPAHPTGVPQTFISTPSGGVGTQAQFSLSGVPTNAQTGVSYTVAPGDRLGYLTFNNGSAIAVTLPQAGTGSGTDIDFTHNFGFIACDIGAGTATITPTTSTISYSNGGNYTSGASSMPLSKGQCAWIFSDNTNYFASVNSSNGVTSFTGDGNLISNSGSTGNVTVTLANAGGHKWWGNNTASSAAPGYETIGLNDLPGNGVTTVNGQSCALAGSCTIPPGTLTIANASVTGTTTNTITKLTGAPSTAVITATTDTGGAIGICTSGCTTTGNAVIQLSGSVSCVFDGATIADDYVQISSSAAGNCHDTNSAVYPAPGTGDVIGRVLSTNGSAGTYTILLFGQEIKIGNSSSVQNSFSAGTVTSGNLACFTGSNVIGNCTTFPPNNFVGVFYNSSGGVESQGVLTVNLDGTVSVTRGDILCASSLSDTAHDNGSTACANGEWVGIVTTTAASVTTATVFLRLQ